MGDVVDAVEEVWVEGGVQASRPVEKKGVSKLLMYLTLV